MEQRTTKSVFRFQFLKEFVEDRRSKIFRGFQFLHFNSSVRKQASSDYGCQRIPARNCGKPFGDLTSFSIAEHFFREGLRFAPAQFSELRPLNKFVSVKTTRDSFPNAIRATGP